MGSSCSCLQSSPVLDDHPYKPPTKKRSSNDPHDIEARAMAGLAAQKRAELYEKSAAGRAARAQIAKQKKYSQASSKGESVLKWQMG